MNNIFNKAKIKKVENGSCLKLPRPQLTIFEQVINNEIGTEEPQNDEIECQGNIFQAQDDTIYKFKHANWPCQYVLLNPFKGWMILLPII